MRHVKIPGGLLMHVETGKIITGEEYDQLTEALQKKHEPIPSETKLDTVRKLQMDLPSQARRSALKSLNRKKNKAARKARKRNRK